PDSFSAPRVCLPGVLVIQGPRCARANVDGSQLDAGADVQRFCDAFRPQDGLNVFPLIVVVDDSDFSAGSLNTFLWVTFTRSNPAADVYGIGAFIRHKHWGCEGALVIDARIKPHHAPPLEEEPSVSKRVDALGALGGPLHGII